MNRRTIATIATLTVLAAAGAVAWWSPWTPEPTSSATSNSTTTVVTVDGVDVPVTNPAAGNGREPDVELGIPPGTDAADAPGIEQYTWYDENDPSTHALPPADPITDANAGDILNADPAALPADLGAYRVSEGEWLVIDTTEDVPAPVTDAVARDARALPRYDLDSQDGVSEAETARETFGYDLYDRTGRWPILVEPMRPGHADTQWRVWAMREDSRRIYQAATKQQALDQVHLILAELSHPEEFHLPVVLDHP